MYGRRFKFKVLMKQLSSFPQVNASQDQRDPYFDRKLQTNTLANPSSPADPGSNPKHTICACSWYILSTLLFAIEL